MNAPATLASVQRFMSAHRDLVAKHARAHVRANAEKIPAEDVAREMEIELAQLARDRGLDPEAVTAPDALIRSIVKHAAGRARRRRKLIEQISAGDDLQAVSEDLAALDSDLPDANVAVTEEAHAARAKLDQVKASLAPRDALIFAVLFEDDSAAEDVAVALSMPASEIDKARVRLLAAAAAAGIEPAPQRRGP